MIADVAVPKVQRRATKPTFTSKLKRTETIKRFNDSNKKGTIRRKPEFRT